MKYIFKYLASVYCIVTIQGCSIFSIPVDPVLSFEEPPSSFDEPYTPSISMAINSKYVAAFISNFNELGIERDKIEFFESSYSFIGGAEGFSGDNEKITWLSIPVSELRSLSFLGNSEFFGSGKGVSPWDMAHAVVDQRNEILNGLMLHDSSITAESGNDLILIAEPDFIYTNIAALKHEKNTKPDYNHAPNDQNDTSIEPPSKMWPIKERLWHKSDKYSELNSARKKIEDRQENQTTIKIAHLDTGYDPEDVYLPPNFNKNRSIDFASGGACKIYGSYLEGTTKEVTHGQRMLSILSGEKITYLGNDGTQVTEYIGGDPHAEVVEYRIASSPVHIRNLNMVKALKCAIDSNIDIVSLSAGGFPSIAQRNVINDAYDDGVAVFAATGDFFHIPIVNVNLIGTSIVFPSRYNRVMGVAGITANDDSYGDSPSTLSAAIFSWNPIQNFGSWSLRGSYGPRYAMKGRVISAYGPNVTHSYSTGTDDRSYRENGAGTSSTTPQAAAAASLWLKYNRDAFSPKEWNSWRKSEAVYQAMIDSAAPPPNNDAAHFGVGLLKANRMLSFGYEENYKDKITKEPRSYIGFKWLGDTLSGLFSGSAFENLVKVDMVLTELDQLIISYRELSRMYEQLKNCSSDENCKKSRRIKLLTKINNVYADKYSEPLKLALKHYLEH